MDGHRPAVRQAPRRPAASKLRCTPVTCLISPPTDSVLTVGVGAGLFVGQSVGDGDERALVVGEELAQGVPLVANGWGPGWA